MESTEEFFLIKSKNEKNRKKVLRDIINRCIINEEDKKYL